MGGWVGGTYQGKGVDAEVFGEHPEEEEDQELFSFPHPFYGCQDLVEWVGGWVGGWVGWLSD